MSDGNTPLKITSRDLAAPEVEDYVASQAYLRRDIGALVDQSWVVKVIYANWFYLAICTARGGSPDGRVSSRSSTTTLRKARISSPAS